MAKPIKPPVSQFSGLKGLSDKTRTKLAASPDAPGQTPPPPPPEKVAEAAPRGPGRPRSKRSDPNFETANLLLRKKTKRAIAARLDTVLAYQDSIAMTQYPELYPGVPPAFDAWGWTWENDAPQDLSELVEYLLKQWLSDTQNIADHWDNSPENK